MQSICARIWCSTIEQSILKSSIISLEKKSPITTSTLQKSTLMTSRQWHKSVTLGKFRSCLKDLRVDAMWLTKIEQCINEELVPNLSTCDEDQNWRLRCRLWNINFSLMSFLLFSNQLANLSIYYGQLTTLLHSNNFFYINKCDLELLSVLKDLL